MTYAQALKKLDANGDGDVSFNEYAPLKLSIRHLIPSFF